MTIYKTGCPSTTPSSFSSGFTNASSSFSRLPFPLPIDQEHVLNNWVPQTPLQNGHVSAYPLTYPFHNDQIFSFPLSHSNVGFPYNEMSTQNICPLTPYYNHPPINENACFGVKDCHTNRLGMNPTSFKRSVDKTSKVNHWTIEEDRYLEKLVREHGEDKWTKIAQSMENRVGKQCRERWMNHLKESIKKNIPWTREEEEVVIKMHKKGERWANISKKLKGRPENAIKNHFNTTKRKVKSAKYQYACTNSTPLQRYIAALIKSTKYGPDEHENDVAETRALIQLFLNFDNYMQEEVDFSNNIFAQSS